MFAKKRPPVRGLFVICPKALRFMQHVGQFLPTLTPIKFYDKFKCSKINKNEMKTRGGKKDV